jgi:hypothetical protein
MPCHPVPPDAQADDPAPIIQIWSAFRGSQSNSTHTDNGGYLRGRAKTQVTFRSKLPRQPASSAGRVHGWRLSTRLRLRSRVVPVALDPVRGNSGRYWRWR